jgi:hypothetical protein
MSNAEQAKKTPVKVTLAGKERTLVLDFNALASAEELMQKRENSKAQEEVLSQVRSAFKEAVEVLKKGEEIPSEQLNKGIRQLAAIARPLTTQSFNILQSINWDSPGIRDIRLIIWAALLGEEPEVTLEEVGSMIAFQDLPKLGKAIASLFEQASPPQDEFEVNLEEVEEGKEEALLDR